MEYSLIHMARRIFKKLNMAIEKEAREKLFKEFSGLRSQRDLQEVFSKFLSDKEIERIYRRFAVIEFIKQGKKYRQIKEMMEVSSNTISNVKDMLAGRGYGRNPKRKRVYSEIKYFRKIRKTKPKKFFRNYKGAESIL